MSEYTLAKLIEEVSENPNENDFFELEKPQLLEVNLNNQKIYTKAGAMVAYTGNINYKREGMLDQGLGNLSKKAITGEGAKLMIADGTENFILQMKAKK